MAEANLWTIDPDFGCWLWIGSVDRKGYGKATGGVAAHLWLWRRLRGDLPRGVQLDHMCRRPRCVRPEHLDPVTGSENMRRTFARYRRELDRCPEGHNLEETGKATPEGGVVCRTCCSL